MVGSIKEFLDSLALKILSLSISLLIPFIVVFSARFYVSWFFLFSYRSPMPLNFSLVDPLTLFESSVGSLLVSLQL